jgi:ATP-dependent protease ClpP protease subunit
MRLSYRPRNRKSRSRLNTGHELGDLEIDTIVKIADDPDHISSIGPDKGVVAEENRIYFYAPVTESTVLDLNKMLRSLDIEMQCLSVRFSGASFPIELHIHSGGGDLFSGLAAVDTIRTVKTPIHTYVDGSAASAATLMSLAGDKRLIYKNSFMLIHQLSSMMMEGTHEEFKDEFENQQRLMNRIKTLYREKVKMAGAVLDELLKHDLWLDSDKCLEYGLVDEVL